MACWHYRQRLILLRPLFVLIAGPFLEPSKHLFSSSSCLSCPCPFKPRAAYHPRRWPLYKANCTLKLLLWFPPTLFSFHVCIFMCTHTCILSPQGYKDGKRHISVTFPSVTWLSKLRLWDIFKKVFYLLLRFFF